MARWYRMSTQFLNDPKIERLGDIHGPAAVSTIVALFGQAMLQEKGGTVERTFKTLATESFNDRDVVKSVIADAAKVGLLTIEEQDEFMVRAHLVAWKRHQDAGRKAESRERQKASPQADVTRCHDLSDDVPHKTRQDKTEEDLSTTTLPTPAQTVFDAWVKSAGRDPVRTKFTSERRNLINRQLKLYPVDELVDAVRGWRHSKHHRGENEQGTVYNDITLLLRNAKQIETFRDYERKANARATQPREVAMP